MPHLNQLPDNVRRVYLIGICGTAMASLAGMLQQRGYEVTGSDEHVYPPMSTYLESLRIPVLEGYTKEHLETFRPDVVVIGNAAARTNAEAAATVELDLPYTSMPEAIYNLFIKGKHSIVITGTHGKTTTTSLMAWILEAAGRDPSMVVGGIPLNFNQNFKLGEGPDFVIEGDEYNTAFFDKGPKFMHYFANTLLVNNIEFDHADIYADLDAIIRAFRGAVEQIAPGDVIIANGDDANVRPLRSSAKARWITFGSDKRDDMHATGIEFAPETTSFTAWWAGKEWFRFTTTLSGRHNVLNALAVIAVADELEVPLDVTRDAVAGFHGVQRRFTVLGQPAFTKNGKQGDVMIVDDYGHHPAEVEATLDAAQRGFDRRVVVAFQPHRYTRTKSLFDEFTRAFNRADVLLVTEVYAAGEKPIEGASGKALADAIRAHGHHAVTYVADKKRMAQALLDVAEPGDIVIALGAGDINASARELLAILQKDAPR